MGKYDYGYQGGRTTNIVFEAWPQQAHLWVQGPISKGPVTARWKELGYISRCSFMQTTRHGGAIVKNRLIVACYQAEEIDHWSWPTEEEVGDVVPPMSNLLTLPGLVKV